MIKNAIHITIACLCFYLHANAEDLTKNLKPSDEYERLRIKWKNELTGAGAGSSKYTIEKQIAITSEGQLQWDKLNKNPERTYLWNDLQSTKISAEITYAYRRIYAMALAYTTEGSSLKGNKTLQQDIIKALEWMNANRYVKMYNDWWDFQIGAPLELNNCITLMYDDLSEAQRSALNQRVAKLTGNPTTDTGANRAWRAFVWALNGILNRDPAKIEISRDALSAIFTYTTSGDGFYTDGSFVQHHDHPYNLGYGIDALAKISELMNLLNGSTWTVIDPNSQYLYKWIYDSYMPFIYKGIAMDMVRGREMSRSYREDYKSGFLMIGIIAKIAQFAPAPHAATFKSMIKYWLNSNDQRNYFADAVNAFNISLNTINQVQSIYSNPDIKPVAELILYKQFSMMDRAIKLGPGFGFGISMHSKRIANYEGDIKNENKQGWHTADGMTYLYNADLNQFSDNFWPTVNNHRLPGTTVLASTPIGSDKRSDRDWVGGASLSDLYGVTGMDFHAIGYSLEAKKSWFMFDNEIVALGAGISSKDDKPVETIVENRKLNYKGNNSFTINGKTRNKRLGWSNALQSVNSAHLKGNIESSDIGYFFPGGANLKAIREARSATWNSVNGNPAMRDTITHTNNFFTLWFDHGVNPGSAIYSYVLLPGFTKKQVNQYAKKPQISVLRNDSLVQAVKETSLNITGANFWTNNDQSVGIISCNKKAAVIIKESLNELEICASDPTMANSKSITLTISKSAKSLISKDEEVTVVQLSPKIILNINVNAAMGNTFKAKFKYDQ